MKKAILSIVIILISVLSSMGQTSNTMEQHTHNYVVLTKKVPQLQPIILTAKALAEEDGEYFGDFQVIICGKTVTDLRDGNEIKQFIEKAEAANVKIVVCGFSIKKFKVDKNDIPQELEIVDNGILHNFQLQKKGYMSIAL
jgi:intracellular sulfur oxidation DsrE/DsrF family protein